VSTSTIMIEIFELADIAAILGVEKSRVKNWTMGKPFSVRPSVRTSSGTGSSNLFSRNDVYVLALVERLNSAHVPSTEIQRMLEEKRGQLTDDSFWKDHYWVVIRRSGREVWFDFGFDAQSTINITLDPQNDVTSFEAVNLQSLVEAVSTKIGIRSRSNAVSSRPPKRERKNRRH
jgi:hypothetical protein